MMKKYCDNCGITHTSLMCFNKPRTSIKKKRSQTYEREIETKTEWFNANPGPIYDCYLKISPLCLGKLNRETVIQEHVIPKSRGEKYKYDINNIRPACSFCNQIKGSQTIESLIKSYPLLAFDTD